MKFTSEDLMKAMRLAIGDRISAVNANNDPTIYNIVEISGSIFYEKEGNAYSLFNLIGRDFEILPKPKRVGDLNGYDYGKCINCPLRLFSYCGDYCDGNLSLYKVLEEATDYVKRKGLFDQEIYDLLKKRLDKEVVEE